MLQVQSFGRLWACISAPANITATKWLRQTQICMPDLPRSSNAEVRDFYGTKRSSLFSGTCRCDLSLRDQSRGLPADSRHHKRLYKFGPDCSELLFYSFRFCVGLSTATWQFAHPNRRRILLGKIRPFVSSLSIGFPTVFTNRIAKIYSKSISHNRWAAHIHSQRRSFISHVAVVDTTRSGVERTQLVAIG